MEAAPFIREDGRQWKIRMPMRRLDSLVMIGSGLTRMETWLLAGSRTAMEIGII